MVFFHFFWAPWLCLVVLAGTYSAALEPATTFCSHGEEEKAPLSLLPSGCRSHWGSLRSGNAHGQILLFSLLTGDLSAWLLLSSPVCALMMLRQNSLRDFGI